MKLKETIITITNVVKEEVDKNGYTFLRCKGYHRFLHEGDARFNGFNHFTSVKIYPVNEEQITETKNRLAEQEVDKPFLKIVAYKSELITPILNGKICPILTVYKYDFERNKLFNKRDLIK